MERYRVLSHTADTAIEASAVSLDDLFENLAYGMFDLMFDLEQIESSGTTTVDIVAATLEDLLVDSLAELLYEAECRDQVFSAFSAHVDEKEFEARLIVSGSGTSDAELRGPPIKAVTYHDLELTKDDAGWYGRVVFDV